MTYYFNYINKNYTCKHAKDTIVFTNEHLLVN